MPLKIVKHYYYCDSVCTRGSIQRAIERRLTVNNIHINNSHALLPQIQFLPYFHSILFFVPVFFLYLSVMVGFLSVRCPSGLSTNQARQIDKRSKRLFCSLTGACQTLSV